MPPVAEKASKFLNNREWRTFLSGAQSAAAYPCFTMAVRTGQAWLGLHAARACGWLSTELGAGAAAETLRI